jgi:hypothetical protein
MASASNNSTNIAELMITAENENKYHTRTESTTKSNQTNILELKVHKTNKT